MKKEEIYCPYCNEELKHQATDDLFGKMHSFFDCLNCKRRLVLCDEKDLIRYLKRETKE